MCLCVRGIRSVGSANSSSDASNTDGCYASFSKSCQQAILRDCLLPHERTSTGLLQLISKDVVQQAALQHEHPQLANDADLTGSCLPNESSKKLAPPLDSPVPTFFRHSMAWVAWNI